MVTPTHLRVETAFSGRAIPRRLLQSFAADNGRLRLNRTDHTYERLRVDSRVLDVVSRVPRETRDNLNTQMLSSQRIADMVSQVLLQRDEDATVYQYRRTGSTLAAAMITAVLAASLAATCLIP